MNDTGVDKHAELLRLREKQIKLTARLERARRHVDDLELKCTQNAQRLRVLQTSQVHVLGRHNIKNQQMHLVWRIIEAGLQHPDAKKGLLQRELFDAVFNDFRDLKAETFRSYLHRFKKEDLICKRGAYWFINDQHKP